MYVFLPEQQASTNIWFSELDFVLDLAPNGDLQSYIARLGSFSADCTRWYMAQVVDAVQWMHSRGIIHRYVLCCAAPLNIVLKQFSQSEI